MSVADGDDGPPEAFAPGGIAKPLLEQRCERLRIAREFRLEAIALRTPRGAGGARFFGIEIEIDHAAR